MIAGRDKSGQIICRVFAGHCGYLHQQFASIERSPPKLATKEQVQRAKHTVFFWASFRANWTVCSTEYGLFSEITRLQSIDIAGFQDSLYVSTNRRPGTAILGY
jgi:hypothetical protein